MEKIIEIDGKQVLFKTNGAFLFKYKAQFKRDALKDLVKISKAIGKNNEIDEELLDFDIFFYLAWTMAKTANPTLLPPEEWLETFDEFPIMDIAPQLMDLLEAVLTSSKKK